MTASPSNGSAFLSKRARELQESDSNSFHPQSPQFPSDALSTVPEQVDNAHSVTQGRPRAGTLPSTFHLADSRTNRHLGPSASISNPTHSLPGTGATTPVSDFPFASRPNSLASNPLASPSSRLRSGSLTIPPSGLANAFNAFGGTNVFGTGAWTPRPVGSGMSNPSRLFASSHPTNEDDSHVRTLGYLGLEGDDPGFGFGTASANRTTGLRDDPNQLPSTESITDDQQRATQGRIRSQTVAAAYSKSNDTFTRARGSTYSTSSSPSRNRKSLDEDFYSESTSTGGYIQHSSNSSTDSTRLLYSTAVPAVIEESASSFPSAMSAFRPRAATIGNVEEQRDVFMRRRAGTMAAPGHRSRSSIGNSSEPQMVAPGNEEIEEEVVLSRTGQLLSQSPVQQWKSGNRSITPEPQAPTRSLWIGNLDPHTTLNELRAVFEPYGPIDTCRLLQEKECAFVNFIHLHDAIRAKEDVLDRLGGQLSASSSLVRIGYGKEVSASSTPQLNRSGLSPSLAAISLLEPSVQAAPTRALWIGSIPSSTTSSQILAIFSPFGPIESARVLTHKSCGFVNFERVEDAMSARQSLNGYEILGGEAGPVRIGFAKVPSKMPFDSAFSPSLLDSPSLLSSYGPSTSFEQAAGGLESYHSNLAVGLAVGKAQSAVGGAGGQSAVASAPVVDVEAVQTVLASSSETQLLMRGLSRDDADIEAHVAAVAESSHRAMYYTTVPQHLASDPVLGKRYGNADAMRLRDIRKRLDEPISAEEVDELAISLIEEVIPLSSDYIGNTIIQKIFERATLAGRLAVLERLAPHLATIGTHKNGTWSVQKLIQCAQKQEEFLLIGQNLRPFTPPLLLNDFGNYVVQGALRFGAPACDFIFDAMVDRIWEIGSGRFGARSTRQILETQGVSPLQIKRVAIAILLNAIPLATSANGTLLLTWLLDSSNLPNRYRLLAPRFAPALAHLCTHKLASVTVHKVVCQTADPQASKIILEALFDSKTTILEDVLGDQAHGIASVSKLINSRTDSRDRARMIDRVKTALTNLHVQAVPAYQRFLNDLADQTPNSPAPPPSHFHGPRHHLNFPTSNGPPPNWAQQPPPPQQQQFGPPVFHQGPYGYPAYPPPQSYGQYPPYPSSPYANGPPPPMHQLHPSQIQPNFIGGFVPPPIPLSMNGLSPNLHPAMLPPMARSPVFSYPTSPEMGSAYYAPNPPFGRVNGPYNTHMNNAGFPPLQ